MTKVPVTATSTLGGKPGVRKAQLDLERDDDVSCCGLGAKVRIIIEGSITELRGVETYEYSSKDKGEYPGKMGLEVDKFKVENIGQFDGMDDDDGDEN